ncbi:MAG: hypothetical protein ACTSU9_18085 [Promethearchaeota archaeon]
MKMSHACIKQWKSSLLLVFGLFLVVGLGQLGLYGDYRSNDDFQTNFEDSIERSQVIGMIDVNLSQYTVGSYEVYPVTITAGLMYNITINSTGDADFEVSLVTSETSVDYSTQVSTGVYSDEILDMAVPMWGNYNTWNSLTFSSIVTRGVSVNRGQSRSLLLYIDPSMGIASIPATFLVILGGTGNPFNNTARINWSQFNTSASDVEVEYSTNVTADGTIINPGSIATVSFGTENNAPLTNQILNQTTSTNGSTTLVKWEKDLSGNVKRTTGVMSGSDNEVFVPRFLNMELDGTVQLGLLINTDPSNWVDVQWDFNEVTDPTLTHASINASGEQIDFQLDGTNAAWRVLELSGASYLSVTFSEAIPSTQPHWDIAVSFYAIGRSTGNIFNLDVHGDNESESVTIFAVGLNNEFKSTTTSILGNSFSSWRYWMADQGNEARQVNDIAGTRYLGMKIQATQNTSTLSNFSCNVNFTSMAIPDQDDNEGLDIGTENGTAFDTFEMFKVRKFSFSDFSQFRWSIHAENASTVDAESVLLCSSPLDDRYPHDLNNAIFSIPVDTTSLSGTIRLNFTIKLDIMTNADFYLHVNNSAGLSPSLDTFTSIATPELRSYDITSYSDSNVQIVFNLTTPSVGPRGLGPFIDNIVISNGTDTVFSETFEVDLSQWTQFDNNGGDALYWRIDRDTQSFNNPVVDVVYPNTIYTMEGYLADPFFWSDYTKVVMDYNPFIQEGHVGYIVVSANSALNQNFTVTVENIEYEAIDLGKGTDIDANHTYPVITFQSGYYWESTVEMDDYYEFYKLQVKKNYKYEVTFTISGGSDLIYFTGCVYSSNGIQDPDLMDGFYGFIQLNRTYIIKKRQDGVFYFKFDGIEYDTTITVNVKVINVFMQLPWGWITIGILAFIALLELDIINRNKKVIRFRRERRTKTPKIK